MLKINLTVLFLAFIIMGCNGQPNQTSRLTERNLPKFFKEWKENSDRLAAEKHTTDTLITTILSHEFSLSNQPQTSDEGITPQYRVVLLKIYIYRYGMEADTTGSINGLSYRHFEYEAMEEYETDSITPPLPLEGLYLTPKEETQLSQFLGGLKSADTLSTINEANVRKLRHYIPVTYGHWGGYWWFYSFPQIQIIIVTHNVIILGRRTSWFEGDEIWYFKVGDRFIRDNTPKGIWIE